MATEIRDFSALGDGSATATGDAVRGVTGLLAALRSKARAWEARLHQRRCLAAFPDELLRDMGVSRGDANIEARKRFWRE